MSKLTTLKKLGVVFGALVLTAGTSLAIAGPGFGDCGGGKGGYGAGHQGPWGGKQAMGARMLEHLDEELQLTAEQKAQIEALMADQQGQPGDRHEAMRGFRDAQRALDPASPSYLDDVAKLAQARAQAMSERMVEKARVHAEIYALLTPEQQSAYEKLRERMGERHKGRHH